MDNNTRSRSAKAVRNKQLADGAAAINKAKAEAAARPKVGPPSDAKPRHVLQALEVHPLAQHVPLMSEDEYAQFRESVKQHGGLQHPIVLYEGKILDGRHRDRACRELGIPRPTELYTGADPEGFVIIENVMRRQLTLTVDQRVALIAKIRGPQWEAEAKARVKAHQFGAKDNTASLKSSEPGKADKSPASLKSSERGKVAQQIASEADVSTYKAEQALKALKSGQIDAVIEKKKSLKQAAKSAPSKPRTSSKQEIPVEPIDRLHKKWRGFIVGFPHVERTRAREIIRPFTAVTWPQSKREVQIVHRFMTFMFRNFPSGMHDDKALEWIHGFIETELHAQS